MAGKLFTRLHGLDGSAHKLRALATNGNVAVRLGIARQPHLDEKTLEVLARRGPDEVRVLVAAHPSLTEATADVILRYLEEPLRRLVRDRFRSVSTQIETGPDKTVEAGVQAAKPASPEHAVKTPENEEGTIRAARLWEKNHRNNSEAESVGRFQPSAVSDEVRPQLCTEDTDKVSAQQAPAHERCESNADAVSGWKTPWTDPTESLSISEIETDFTTVTEKLEEGLELLDPLPTPLAAPSKGTIHHGSEPVNTQPDETSVIEMTEIMEAETLPPPRWPLDQGRKWGTEPADRVPPADDSDISPPPAMNPSPYYATGGFSDLPGTSHEFALGETLSIDSAASPREFEFEADFTAVVDELEQGLEFLGALEDEDLEAPFQGFTAKSWQDEAAELRFMRIFERLPTGKAGEELLKRMAPSTTAPKMHKLKELYDSGLDVESLAVAWAVREYWNEERSFTRWTSPLTYNAIGRLMQAFPSTPDIEEVLTVLRLLEEEWQRRGHSQTRDSTAYITSVIFSHLSDTPPGGHVPFELVIAMGLAF